MIITVTERGSFRRCRRRWDYSSRSRQGLEPIINAPQLVTGHLVHATLEHWLNNSEATATQLRQKYVELAAEDIARVKREYREKVGANVSEDELQPHYEQMQTGLEMIANYHHLWTQPLPDNYKLLQPEQQVIVDIPDTWHWECDECGRVPLLGADIHHELSPRCHGRMRWQLGQLEATFDSLLADEYGRGWIRECKTYKQRPKKEALRTNDQFLAYIWALEQLQIFDEVGGILYDGLWKRTIKPPRVLKNGTLSQARQKYTMEDLFHRDTIVRPREEIDEFGRNLANEFMDMCLNPRIYPNRRWEGCFDCPFDRLCTAESRGEDFDYVKETYYKRRTDFRGLDEDDWGTDNSESELVSQS